MGSQRPEVFFPSTTPGLSTGFCLQCLGLLFISELFFQPSSSPDVVSESLLLPGAPAQSPHHLPEPWGHCLPQQRTGRGMSHLPQGPGHLIHHPVGFFLVITNCFVRKSAGPHRLVFVFQAVPGKQASQDGWVHRSWLLGFGGWGERRGVAGNQTWTFHCRAVPIHHPCGVSREHSHIPEG